MRSAREADRAASGSPKAALRVSNARARERDDTPSSAAEPPPRADPAGGGSSTAEAGVKLAMTKTQPGVFDASVPQDRSLPTSSECNGGCSGSREPYAATTMKRSALDYALSRRLPQGWSSKASSRARWAHPRRMRPATKATERPPTPRRRSPACSSGGYDARSSSENVDVRESSIDAVGEPERAGQVAAVIETQRTRRPRPEPKQGREGRSLPCGQVVQRGVTARIRFGKEWEVWEFACEEDSRSRAA